MTPKANKRSHCTLSSRGCTVAQCFCRCKICWPSQGKAKSTVHLVVFSAHYRYEDTETVVMSVFSDVAEATAYADAARAAFDKRRKVVDRNPGISRQARFRGNEYCIADTHSVLVQTFEVK